MKICCLWPPGACAKGHDRSAIHSQAAVSDIMKASDVALAILTSVIWGLSFIATRYGVDSFTPAQLTALRFAIAALPALILPRPAVPWGLMLTAGAFWFLIQFLLLFWAFHAGMLPGLASVVQQMSAPFTVLLAALLLGETPTRRQVTGLVIALSGLVLIGFSSGADLPLIALVVTLGAALSWSFGNILIKRMPKAEMVSLTAWMALVAPLPALALSHALGDPPLWTTLAEASWRGILSALYLGTLATIGGYAMWGHLLSRYPAAVVTPFALLVPCSGIIASVIVFDEAFPPLRCGGIALVMAGLAVIIWRARTPPAEVPPA